MGMTVNYGYTAVTHMLLPGPCPSPFVLGNFCSPEKII